MNEQPLKHNQCLNFNNLNLTIFKKKLQNIPNLPKLPKLPKTPKFSQPPKKDVKTKNNSEINKINELDSKPKPQSIPQFMTLSKIDFDMHDVRAGLIKDPTARGGIRYQVIEPILSERDAKALDIIKKLLMTELSVSMNSIKSKEEARIRLGRKIDKMIKTYRLKIPTKNIARIKYYAIRDFVHLGKIEPLMRDHMIEEISCDGTNIPLYVWHRELESIPTNIIYQNEEDLNNFTRKLAYICGKHVSMADPIVDATLPDGSRINLTLGQEITKRGSTFTIRRFRADPITIIDLIKFGTCSIDIAAFLWFLAEKKSTMLYRPLSNLAKK